MSSVLRKTNGELLAKQIHDAMWERDLTIKYVAQKAKISIQTFYNYMKMPGRAPLAVMLRICKAVGIQQITLMTAGTYYER